MAACQNPAPGAEGRVGKCPSSAPSWRAQVHINLHHPSTLYCCLASVAPHPPQLFLNIALNFSLLLSHSKTTLRQTRRLCQLNGMCCMPQITHTCYDPQINPFLFLSFSLSLPLYTLDGATQFYGSCVL